MNSTEFINLMQTYPTTDALLAENVRNWSVFSHGQHMMRLKLYPQNDVIMCCYTSCLNRADMEAQHTNKQTNARTTLPESKI